MYIKLIQPTHRNTPSLVATCYNYKATAPTRVKRRARPVTTKGPLFTGPATEKPAALWVAEALAEELEPEPEPEPLPEPVVGEAASPAHWEPAPLRPGPLPAPFSKYYFFLGQSVSGCFMIQRIVERGKLTFLAAAGISGSSSESTSQSSSLGGQSWALVVWE